MEYSEGLIVVLDKEMQSLNGPLFIDSEKSCSKSHGYHNREPELKTKSLSLLFLSNQRSTSGSTLNSGEVD